MPLLYEGRLVEQQITGNVIDRWFERISEGLTDKQKADLKRKFSRMDALGKTGQAIRAKAFDISEHFRQHWQGTGFKAQLVAPSKAAAVRFKEVLDEIGHVTSAIVISPPDDNEGNEEVDKDSKDLVRVFWDRMMVIYKTEDEYNRQIIDAFKGSGELKRSVQLRYQETVDLKEFEPKIQKLLDDHVVALPAETIIALVNINDADALKAVVDETGVSDASKADRIASATRAARSSIAASPWAFLRSSMPSASNCEPTSSRPDKQPGILRLSCSKTTASSNSSSNSRKPFRSLRMLREVRESPRGGLRSHARRHRGVSQ